MSPIVREYYRVPREDRGVWIRPPAGELPALVERNRWLLASWSFEFAGRPLGEFCAAARRELIGLAQTFACEHGLGCDAAAEDGPVIVTGHQPGLFHPGVWIKNFLASALARAVGGTALNLSVDNDEAGGLVLRFPVREGGADDPPGAVAEVVRTAEVRLADVAPGMAYEEVSVRSLRQQAVEGVRAALVPGPMADAFRRWWRLLAEAAPRAANLREALVVARRRLEEACGTRNLELPVSRLADGEAFRLFVAEMLRWHEELFAAHNESLAEYRRVYRERSAAQPVPDLAREGACIEMPFWVWRTGEARRRLWVEPADETRAPLAVGALRQARQPDALRLFAERDAIGTIDIRARRGSGGRPADVDQLAALRQAGWKIRPRALTLTLFARLAVGDVFIHGLGGALYDKVTDGIFERLFGVRPPEIVLASCTVRLPVEAYPSTPRDLEAARRRVRDWRFNPDRLLSGADRSRAEATALIDEKWRLIREREATRDGRSRAWRRIRAINESLAALAPDGPRAAAEDLARVERELKWNAILQSREYPICFYPAEELAAFYREATRI
jgi:hypothetical protein